MNWVGGWRSRVMKSTDIKKQKEFFEKKRMQKRRNLLCPPPSASPKGEKDSNVDLLTMFIVNQIALKKANTGKPKITHMPDSDMLHKPLGGKSIELPMSPCSPSRLSLAQSEPLYSDQALDLKKRKHNLLDELKFKMTNMADNSASESQHHVQDSTSLFSSSSLNPSEAFKLHTRPTEHISPPSTLEPQSTNTSQGLCEFNPWSTNQTQPSHTIPTHGDQFGSALYSTDTNGPSINSSEYTLNALQQSKEEEQVFLGFNSEEYGDEDLFSNRTMKIRLQHLTPTSPTEAHDFSATYRRDHAHFLSQESGHSDCRPCTVLSNVSDHACQSLRQVGSDDASAATNCGPSLTSFLGEQKKQCTQAGVSHMGMLCPSDTPVNCSTPGMSAARVLSFSPNVPCNTDRDSKAQEVLDSWFNNGQGCDEDQFVPSHLQTVTQSVCKKASPRTRDQDTQTAHSTSRDASVQCRLLKTRRRYSLRKASATRRQSGQSKARLRSKTRSETKWDAPCMMRSTREAAQQAPETIKGSHDAENQGSLHRSDTNAPEPTEQSAENMLVKGERREGLEQQSANNILAEKPERTAERDGAADTSRNSASKGARGVYEIADILLTLRQKNKHP